MDIRNPYNSRVNTDRSADFSRIRLNVEKNLADIKDKVSLGNNQPDLKLIPGRLPNPGKTEKTGIKAKISNFMHSKSMKAAMLGALVCTSFLGSVSMMGCSGPVNPPAKSTEIVQELKEGELQEIKGKSDALEAEKLQQEKEEKAQELRKQLFSPKAPEYDDIIEEASEKYDVDADFIRSIIQQESKFNHKATSHVGAGGMMQLMPRTAKSLGVKNRYDPHDNIMGGVKYIKQLLDRFDGDKEMALAAYNAGPTVVRKYGKVPPFKETQKFVNNIMDTYQQLNEI